MVFLLSPRQFFIVEVCYISSLTKQCSWLLLIRRCMCKMCRLESDTLLRTFRWTANQHDKWLRCCKCPRHGRVSLKITLKLTLKFIRKRSSKGSELAKLAAGLTPTCKQCAHEHGLPPEFNPDTKSSARSNRPRPDWRPRTHAIGDMSTYLQANRSHWHRQPINPTCMLGRQLNLKRMLRSSVPCWNYFRVWLASGSILANLTVMHVGVKPETSEASSSSSAWEVHYTKHTTITIRLYASAQKGY